MKIQAGDSRSIFCRIYLDGVEVTNATRADDRAGYVDVIRVVDGDRVRDPHNPGHYLIDRLYGKVSIQLHRMTKRARSTEVLIPIRS